MIPNPDYDYPDCPAELSIEAKKQRADEIYEYLKTQLAIPYQPILDYCQNDFRLASLVAYRLAVDFFKDNISHCAHPEELRRIEPLLLPVNYCGGDICFGRVFSINHCAFPSPDSIIGFRNSETTHPQEYFKILKGLKYIGCHNNWVFFKLDRSSTDDMTGMLYSPLEKNFTIEFAHFPHDGSRRFIYRWEDC